MKIALVQFNSLVGDIEGNTGRIRRWIRKAREAKADLVCFHELALIGYPPRDLLELPYMVEKCKKASETIAGNAVGITVVVGGIEQNPGPGKPLFNTALWCEDGSVRARVHKSLLPSYDVFDETRYFEPGCNHDVIDYKGCKWGISICEDIWYDPVIWKRQLYPSDPMEELAKNGMQILVNLSASPYSLGKFNLRKEMICRLAKRRGITVVYVNQVGGNDELVFDGGSMVVDRDGNLLARGAFFRESMTVVDLDQKVAPLPKVPDDVAFLEEALVCGLRDYVKKCGFEKVALGLSGGIDSAVTAFLAVKAVGAGNVLGLVMPSRYSSKGSVEDSRQLAKNLGITILEIPLKAVHRSYEKIFGKIFGRAKLGTTAENIQARIRGNLLMAVSNQLGHLVLSTGNKSELAVGYCTLYGDLSGGLAVISDLPKTMVYNLARHINRKKEIIPSAIISKPPSAELKPNQLDCDTLPPYDILDGVLKAFIEDFKSEEEIVRMGYKPAVVRKIIRMIRANEYKRSQAPLGLKVTSKAFGMGRRFPIACKM